MSEGKAKIYLLRLVRSVQKQAVSVEKMAPKAFFAKCGLCHAHGSGTSEKDAAAKLNHGNDCSLRLVAQTKKEFRHAAA